MKNYRIKKVIDERGEIKYFPQVKFLFWWYNPYKWEPYNDGGFYSLENAQEALCEHIRKSVVEYIDFNPEVDCK